MGRGVGRGHAQPPSPASLQAQTGRGWWQFELINAFETYRFWLFTGGLTYPTPVASTDALLYGNSPPLRGHLARTFDPTEMQVTWHSADNDGAWWAAVCGEAQSPPTPTLPPAARTVAASACVKWGASTGNYTGSAAAGVSATYAKADMCGAPANGAGWFEPHVWHTAVMTGLVPGQRVFYIYGSDTNGGCAGAGGEWGGGKGWPSACQPSHKHTRARVGSRPRLAHTARWFGGREGRGAIVCGAAGCRSCVVDRSRGCAHTW
jgi:hypothetical protein